MKKILFINPAHPFLKEGLLSLGYICEEAFEASKGEIEQNVKDYFGVIIRSRFQLDEIFFQKAKKLKFVARTGVGVEHIDLVAAKKYGVQVFTSPEGSRDAVGEHTIGLLLMLMNNLSRADREVRAGKWVREGNRGIEIKGKTVGIIGYGNMGQAFARRLQGFDSKVIAYDKFKSNYEDQYAKEVDLDTIFAESDIVSFHIPYLKENHHLVNKVYLQQFHKNIYLVNTARGLILNTEDLVQQLKEGKVLGAALDVIEYEETSFAHLSLENLPEPFQYLRQAPNVILNPHIAGWSHEAKKGHAKVLVEKIKEAF